MSACTDVTARLEAGSELDASLRAHLERCTECRRLERFDRGLHAIEPNDVAGPPESLRDAIARESTPTPVARRPFRAAPAVLASIAISAAILVVRPRADLGRLAPVYFWGLALVWFGLFAGAMFMLLRRGRLGLGIAAVWRWTYVLTSVAAFEVLVWMTTPRGPYGLDTVGLRVWLMHARCAVWGTLVAAAVGALIVRAARRMAAVSPESAGAVAGCAAGMSGVLALHASCGFTDALHFATVHAVPIVLAVVAGRAASRKTLSP